MAVIGADPGAEFYFSRSIAQAITDGVWSTNSGGVGFSNSAPAGRQAASDGKVYAIALGGSAGNSITKALSANYSHLILGKAYYIPSGVISAAVLLQFQDAGTNQCDLRVDGTGHLVFTRNGTVLATSSAVLGTGWQYIEAEIVFTTGATGSAQCWVNGTSVINTSSVQTTTSGNAYANRYVISAINGGCFFRDLYLLDATTGANTTHLGDVTVGVKYPNAAGVNQQWTPSSGTQVSCVQDGITHTGTWPDGDTSYISDSTAGHISDFAHETLSLTGTLLAVVHVSYVRKDDAGSRAFRQVCLSGGTTETNGADISATNTYLYYFDVLDQDPNTSAQWTLANFNAATFGVKEIT
jgi:hypothetical protein